MKSLYGSFLSLVIFTATAWSASNEEFSRKLRQIVDDMLGAEEFQVRHASQTTDVQIYA